MSIEIVIAPLIIDAVIASAVLVESLVSPSISVNRKLLTEEEIREMRMVLGGTSKTLTLGDVKSDTGTAVVIGTNRGYNINLRRNEEGTYDIVTEWKSVPGKAKIKEIKSDIESVLRQKYAYEKVKKELAKKGYVLAADEVQGDNSIRLVARKW